MEKYFALIKKNIVQSVVVGDDDFYNHIKDQYDFVIDVTNIDRPSVDDSYYPETDSFVSNHEQIHELPVNIADEEHLQMGTDDGFEPFKISKYVVRYEDGMIKIGCKSYSAAGFMDALHKMVIDKEESAGCFTIIDGQPAHGKFKITWEDAKKLYDALSKVRLE